MSADVPGMGGFFPSMFTDLLRLLRTEGPIQWDLALQLAQSVAAEGGPEPNVDPVERIRLEGLVGIAELHVADVTGMSTTPGGRPISIVTSTRAEWARRALEGWRWILEDVAKVITPAAGESGTPQLPGMFGVDDPEQNQEFAALLGQWTTAMAPAMTAMQIGSVIGHLARRTLGQYDLPLPRKGHDELDLVPSNIHTFVEEWSLPADDTALWLITHDVATHAVLSRPHVAARIGRLLVDHARGLRPDPGALGERLSEAMTGELSDLGDLTRLLGDPSALAPASETPETRATRAELDALSAVLGGYVEWATDAVAGRAIAGRGAVREAMRRRRVARGADERVAESLFGLRLDQDQLDRGQAFVRGVLERGGESELAKLWVVEANLPTPAEVDAPGLWIERVNLPPQSPPASPG